ncbi:MAG: Methyltransferase type 12 [Verrucomicrobiales bacterium]|nr:Methyltransferase type 12 [Verrucomicrobiales bacterium]
MSFDLLAPHYRWMEAVLAGNKLQQCRVHWLDSVRDCRRVLLVGEGNGRFLEACAKAMPLAQFTVVDASIEMLRQAERRWTNAGGNSNRAKFVQATLPGLNLPKESFDLVVTNCFLDCFTPEQLEQVVAEIAACTTDSAVWIVTDFAVPQRGFAKWRAKAVLRAAYMFFRLTTRITALEICPPDASLTAAGFELKGRHEADAGLIYSAKWQRTKRLPRAKHTEAHRHDDNRDTPHEFPKATADLRA